MPSGRPAQGIRPRQTRGPIQDSAAPGAATHEGPLVEAQPKFTRPLALRNRISQTLKAQRPAGQRWPPVRDVMVQTISSSAGYFNDHGHDEPGRGRKARQAHP